MFEVAIVEGAARCGGIVKLPGVETIMGNVGGRIVRLLFGWQMVTFPPFAAGIQSFVAQSKVGHMHFRHPRICDLCSQRCGNRHPRCVRRCRRCGKRETCVSAFDDWIDIIGTISHLGAARILIFSGQRGAA